MLARTNLVFFQYPTVLMAAAFHHWQVTLTEKLAYIFLTL